MHSFDSFTFLLFIQCVCPNPYVHNINCPNRQSGIDRASHVDMDLVTPGIYIEDINSNARNIILC